jgi:FMN-binding domain.
MAIRRHVVRSLIGLGICCGIAGCPSPGALNLQGYMSGLGITSVNLGTLSPGSYTGDYVLALPPGTIAMNRHFNVTVTIGSEGEVGVKINKPSPFLAPGPQAQKKMSDKFQALIGRITDAKAVPVDVVSGATYSSIALLMAVEKAVAPCDGSSPSL